MFTVVSMWNTGCILILLFIYYCIIFHTNNCKPPFAPPGTYILLLLPLWRTLTDSPGPHIHMAAIVPPAAHSASFTCLLTPWPYRHGSLMPEPRNWTSSSVASFPLSCTKLSYGPCLTVGGVSVWCIFRTKTPLEVKSGTKNKLGFFWHPTCVVA